MKTFFLFVLLTFLTANVFSQTSKIEIFNEHIIEYGWYEQPDVTIEDNGNTLVRDILLPQFSDDVRITAFLEVIPLNDPWDRAGTIKISDGENADVELLKFITAYNVETSHQLDVSNLKSLLTGESRIKANITTYSERSFKINFWLEYTPEPSLRNSDWTEGVFFSNSLERKHVEGNLTEVEVNIPKDLEKVELVYYVSGHCTDGRGADEFESKYNVISIDGNEIHRYLPWRDDCSNFPSQGTYYFSRSGWCPGDIVYPLNLDVTSYLTPGKHKLTFDIENIRGVDVDGNYGYWRVSSHLNGWLKSDNIAAANITISHTDNHFFSVGNPVQFEITTTDENGNRVLSSNSKIELTSSSNQLEYSIDGSEWKKNLELKINSGKRLLWVRSDTDGQYTINATDLNGVIPGNYSSAILFLNNISFEGTAGSNGSCSDEESPQYAIDGDFSTKWCNNNNNQPYYLEVSYPQSYLVNAFRIYHAGSGEEPSYENTIDFDILVKHDENSDWLTVVEVSDNYETEEGNITFHQLDNPMNIVASKLLIYTPNYDATTARIYEFETYNTDITSSADKEDFVEIEDFRLYQNYPNPFNGSTNIKFFIKNYSFVTISIYNSIGELVDEILDADLPGGEHTLFWNGKDLKGEGVAGGVYFYTVSINNILKQTKKMLFIP